MAILEHLVEQSACKLDNLNLSKHKQGRGKTEVVEKKDASAMPGQQKVAGICDNDRDNCLGSRVNSVASLYESSDENHETIPVVPTDGCLYADPSGYAGFAYVPGYIPYLIDGVHYYTPYIDHSPFNQPLYNTFPLDPQYSVPGYGYGTQVYHYMPYAYYQQIPTGDHFFTPGISSGGIMVLEPQEPAQLGVVMSNELNDGSQYAISSPGCLASQLPAGEGASSVETTAQSIRAPGATSVESSLKQGVSHSFGNPRVQAGVFKRSSIRLPTCTAASLGGAISAGSETTPTPHPAEDADASPGTAVSKSALTVNGVSLKETNANVLCDSNGSAKKDCKVASSVYVPGSVHTNTKVRDQVASSPIMSNNSVGSFDKGLGPSPLSREKYSSTNFDVKFDQAKFFIIKSYSENNVHRSIEHGVWASTPAGNRKLDEAYKEAQSQALEKTCCCPVFLFFSVNGSRQFCGVAEMTGPLDYNRTMAFWEQRKWNGSFPVTWHIIKNVPNFQFRKIIIENNESKPVTNSRDTQEVNLRQGLEMLNIFEGYNARTSLLDEFPMLAIQNGIQPFWASHGFLRIGECFEEWDVAMGEPRAKLSSHVPKLQEHHEKPKASQEKEHVEADGKKA